MKKEAPLLPREVMERMYHGREDMAERAGGQPFGGMYALEVFSPEVAHRVMSWPVWEPEGGKAVLQNADGTFNPAFLAAIDAHIVPGEG